MCVYSFWCVVAWCFHFQRFFLESPSTTRRARCSILVVGRTHCAPLRLQNSARPQHFQRRSSREPSRTNTPRIVLPRTLPGACSPLFRRATTPRFAQGKSGHVAPCDHVLLPPWRLTRWVNTGNVVNHPNLRGLRHVRIRDPPAISRFWRWHSEGKGHICTAEGW